MSQSEDPALVFLTTQPRDYVLLTFLKTFKPPPLVCSASPSNQPLSLSPTSQTLPPPTWFFYFSLSLSQIKQPVPVTNPLTCPHCRRNDLTLLDCDSSATTGSYSSNSLSRLSTRTPCVYSVNYQMIGVVSTSFKLFVINGFGPDIQRCLIV